MRVSRTLTSLSALCLFVACGSDKERAPPVTAGGAGRAAGGVASGGVTSGGAPSGGVASSGAPSGGSSAGAAEAGAAGADPAAGAAGELQAGAGGSGSQPTPTICLRNAVWSAGVALSVSTDGDDVLGAVTPDELSIVWMSAEQVYYADRSTRDEDFGAVSSLPANADYFSQVTLAPNGLTLIGVRLDGAGFGELRRAARGEAFVGTPDEAPYEALYGAPAVSYSSGPFGDPVVSPSGLILLYSALDVEAPASIFESRRAGASWPWGKRLFGATLSAESGAFRRPSAISADLRTLFYWDELLGEQRLSWRDRVDAPFTASESMGSARNATPNAACDRLYYSSPGAAGDDLFVSSRN